MVSHLEELEWKVSLAGTEIFVITNNLPFEGTFYKGHSSSKLLNEIILRLRVLQL